MELQTSSSESQTFACSTAYSHKAWHFVSVLLFLGRPARPAELAERCTFFCSTPEFVEFLCWMPDSPLSLTDNGLVTLSPVVLVACGRFLASSIFEVKIGGWTVPRSLGGHAITTYFRKRKRSREVVVPFMRRKSGLRFVGEQQDDNEAPVFGWTLGAHRNAFQAYDDLCAQIDSAVNVPKVHTEATFFNRENYTKNNPLKYHHSHPTMSFKDKGEVEQNTCVMDNADLQESKHNYMDNYLDQVRRAEQSSINSFFVQPRSLASLRADSILLEETYAEDFLSNKGNHSLSCMGIDKSCQLKLVEFPSARNAPEDHDDNVLMQLESSHDIPEMNNKDLNSSSDTVEENAYIHKDIHKESMIDSKIKLVEKAAIQISKRSLSTYEKPDTHYPQRKPPAKTIQLQQDVSTIKHKYLSRLSRQADEVVPKGKNSKGPNMVLPLKHKAKPILENNISIPEKSGSSHFNSSKGHLNTKALPKFHLYDVEEEEGSGGYGTVYRARRKTDGIKFAIKYPHPNANKHLVDNERKMLERFGGNNFVIKFEGSCRSENSDCFVLKHVEHDRPDVLKKDIDISELQWYGYCLFTALASLHKLGVVHRDVKPGNFLFSRKTCVGYIIDFNLAKDLHQNQSNTGNSVKLNPKVAKPVSPSKGRRILDARSPGLDPGELSKGYKSMDSKMLRKKALSTNLRKSLVGQGSDGSGLTSAKDVTSIRTPSAERLREPLPCQGRKELINLAQEAMQSSKAGVPAYKRKRIAAPPAIMAKKLVHYTPMPIHSSGIAVPGSGGEGKVQKEGPCAGTKGFRAPEVLLRSPHQGPELDVWSAGVTLLYLLIGKLPFIGDPEQNMKDIVKLRGSEELWELAKIHNRESSFPTELYDARFLEAKELRGWCKGNTKKPEFLKVIPGSLFDLVDRCLTVNPRLRISAEAALQHEFFAPCLMALGKEPLHPQAA